MGGVWPRFAASVFNFGFKQKKHFMSRLDHSIANVLFMALVWQLTFLLITACTAVTMR